jgi:threonine dehydrogenase-like Zn-dependent dehydrogenase
MLAALFKGNGILDVEEIQKPEIKDPDDVLIKIEAASICGSDLHVLHVPPGQYAKPGTVIGHEFFGLIEEVGAGVTEYKPGDFAVVDPIVTCHVCDYCKRGMTNLCPDAFIYGQTLNGGFAQYAVIKASQLYKIPSSIPPQLAAQTEPLSCVMNGMRKLNPTPYETVMIYGAGSIGLTFIRVMKLYGVKRLAVCEVSEKRREVALNAGADVVIDPVNEDAGTKLKETWNEYCDIIVDAVGIGPVFGQAVNLLKGGGRLLIFGQNAKAVSQVPPAVIVRNELTVMGSYCTFHTFPVAIRLLQDERLGLERIITHKFELKDIKQGIDLLNAQQASRVIIFPNGMK